MQIIVTEHYRDGRVVPFEGRPQDVAADLLHAYPFLLKQYGPHASADVLVRALDRQQAYSAAEVNADLILKSERHEAGVDEATVGDQLGGAHRRARAWAGAAFLACRPEVLAPAQALLQAHEDIERAALLAYGLEPDEATVGALRAVLAATAPLDKSEPLAAPKQAVAATPDGERFAAAIQRAIDKGDAFPVKLGGKHGAGSYLVHDQDSDERFLLKPGSGPQSPASGAREESASQAKREAAAYAAAAVMGLPDLVPEAHLIIVDGREFAALRLLPFTFKSAMDLQQRDPTGCRRVFALYLPTGQLHQWAAFDYVIGQTDRHANNVMVRGHQVYLIDHGAAFAGPDFSPASDQMSFVPFYLRAAAPGDFAELEPERKLHALPRLHADSASRLGDWLRDIDDEQLRAALARHGVDPDPSMHRLEQLRQATTHSPADLAVNAAWTIP